MFLGSQIARKVPWNWVTESPGLCWEHQIPASEFPQGLQAVTSGSKPGSSACALASFQELLSLDPPHGMPDAEGHPNWLSVFTWPGISQGAEHMDGWWQLVPCHDCHPAQSLGTTLCPFSLCLPGFSSCALLWQEEMWKIKYYVMSVPVELVHLRSFLSGINDRDLIILHWAVSSTCIHTASDFPSL